MHVREFFVSIDLYLLMMMSGHFSSGALSMENLVLEPLRLEPVDEVEGLLKIDQDILGVYIESSRNCKAALGYTSYSD